MNESSSTRIIDLGYTCPNCGGSAGYYPLSNLWNSYECIECTVWCTIRNAQMEILPRPTTGARTDEDILVEALESGNFKEIEWSEINRKFCDFFHRQQL